MIELGRSSVQAWECDVVGHLNSQFYIERSYEAATALMTMLGYGPRALAGRGLRLEPVDQHMRFLSELAAWRSYKVQGGITRIDLDLLEITCELVEDLTGKVSAAVRTSYRLTDIAAARRVVFDDALRIAAAQYFIEPSPHASPRGLKLTAPSDVITLVRADNAGMGLTATGVIKPAECDDHGLMLPRFFTTHFINGITVLQTPTNPVGTTDRMPGGAAVENRLVYRRWPRAGDAIVVRSAITAVDDRRYNWVHWMFDGESGHCLASNEAVAICMDLDSRKAITMPAEFRRRLEQKLNRDIAI